MISCYDMMLDTKRVCQKRSGILLLSDHVWRWWLPIEAHPFHPEVAKHMILAHVIHVCCYTYISYISVRKNAIASWTHLGWWHSTFGTAAWCVLIKQNKINCSSTIWCDLVSRHWWSLLHLKCYLKQSLENYRSEPRKNWQWNWVLAWIWMNRINL